MRNEYNTGYSFLFTMPDLKQSLQGRDIGHLRIVAQFWGVELTTSEAEAALNQLATALPDLALNSEVLEALPVEVHTALSALSMEKGRMPWVAFVRRFGEIREMGAGRRDRESPHLHPISTAETLFYHALLGRAFFDTPNGPQEFAYIPNDLLDLVDLKRRNDRWENMINPVTSVMKSTEPLGRLASPGEKTHVIPANDKILDDACTLLAALRLGIDPPPSLASSNRVLLDLLAAAHLVSDSTPQPESVKAFLEMTRVNALALLVEAWQSSEQFNELRQIPGLVCEGEWKNQPLVTREFLLDLLAAIPPDKWWSLPAFLRAIKEKYPDFQRPAGDYDSWFIKRQSDGEYLRGFTSWDEVDGALISYSISGILHWLGIVDLASTEEGRKPSAFRILDNDKRAAPSENGKLTVASNGRISVPRLVPRATRYQIARFCEWEEPVKDEYRYRVTPASLTRARQQRLKPDQLLALLQKHAAAPLPPPFVRAIQRWELNGTEARVDNPVVLRVSKPEVLEELRKSKAGRFLGEILGPTTVVVKSGATSKVLAALAELGLLAEETHAG